ncbi:MAG TPA: DUF3037 domain-containing protein [Muribaculum sp.]|jgi:hypothetical protein|uniref:DUF3037 domain-containing protein n=1 Tax=Heminiphilus faecis TaxID=2601703 RepID=A0ABV4CZL1_9BACT|nr:DUF3037 domain-containing protein [Heminiphilus faecis]RLT77338.1 DUF3037 domain-containing protein [bacterium J10(2018)]HRF68241.1 DUF3037 domain-containing protein [Muribaculum sp.]
MPEKHLYEYAVIRYVPRVEREEFVNVGLVMMCKRRRWARVELLVDPVKIGVFGGALTIDEIEHQLSAYKLIGEGHPSGGPMAALPVEERFRWLTAVKSCCIATSRPHPGLTDDLDAAFCRLFTELVL